MYNLRIIIRVYPSNSDAVMFADDSELITTGDTLNESSTGLEANLNIAANYLSKLKLCLNRVMFADDSELSS